MEKGNLLNFLLLLWGSSSSSSSRLVVSKYRHCIAYCFITLMDGFHVFVLVTT